MANSGQITPIRIEKWTLQRVSIPDCSSVSSLEEDYGSTESEDMSISPDMSCRSSADADKNFDLDEDFREKLTKYDDIIEKIENLRLARNNEDINDDNENINENVDRTRSTSSKNVDNIEYRDSFKSQTGRHTDNEDINNNEDIIAADDNESCLLNIRDETRDKERCHSLCDGNSFDDDSETEQAGQRENKDPDDSNLIQRGPIKPDFQPLRGHPYSMVSWLSRANDGADAAYAVDYDKTAEQILRNKDYSEKLNPCLDQLSNSSRNQASIEAMGLAMDPSWNGENNNDTLHNGNPSNDVSFIKSSSGHCDDIFTRLHVLVKTSLYCTLKVAMIRIETFFSMDLYKSFKNTYYI